jgi:hypothetical protein
MIISGSEKKQILVHGLGFRDCDSKTKGMKGREGALTRVVSVCYNQNISNRSYIIARYRVPGNTT